MSPAFFFAVVRRRQQRRRRRRATASPSRRAATAARRCRCLIRKAHPRFGDLPGASSRCCRRAARRVVRKWLGAHRCCAFAAWAAAAPQRHADRGALGHDDDARARRLRLLAARAGGAAGAHRRRGSMPFVTHEHSDHVGCAATLARRDGIALWMSRGTRNAAIGGAPECCASRADGEAIVGDPLLQPYTCRIDARANRCSSCVTSWRLGLLDRRRIADAAPGAPARTLRRAAARAYHDRAMLAASSIRRRAQGASPAATATSPTTAPNCGGTRACATSSRGAPERKELTRCCSLPCRISPLRGWHRRRRRYLRR